jgi:CO/xanthine dehydrogenase Mo-binding subunit
MIARRPHDFPAAVANAFLDATGVRIRRAPLSSERIKAALARI